MVLLLKVIRPLMHALVKGFGVTVVKKNVYAKQHTTYTGFRLHFCQDRILANLDSAIIISIDAVTLHTWVHSKAPGFEVIKLFHAQLS